MENPRYSHPADFPHYPRRHGIPVLKIIGTVLLILILICGGMVTYVAYNFPRWAGSFARGPLVAEIDKLDLPDAQKASIKQNLTRVAQAFEQGRLSFTQLQTIIKKLQTGPFFKLATVEAMRHQYAIAHPQIDSERAETMLLFDRFQRGVAEQRIPQEKIAGVMALAHDPDERHADRPAGSVTEADLNPFIDAMRKAVKTADIPAEPFTPDFAAEIDKAVTAVLGPGALVAQTAPAEDAADSAPAPASETTLQEQN